VPGDLVGLAELWAGADPLPLAALDPVMAVPFEAARLRQAARVSPDLAAGLADMLAHTAADLSTRLSSVARQSAYEQVAGLLRALLSRTQSAGPRDGQVFACPLSQQVMADALGLSVVHVNRSLRRLTHDGVLRKDTQQVRILDGAAFERIARL
jgi:CRP-like cAMP-binding protein